MSERLVAQPFQDFCIAPELNIVGAAGVVLSEEVHVFPVNPICFRLIRVVL